ncbi:MAG: MSCRAMM family adhesin SdrC [Chloroflexi bacterium]|nr:MSCRAMM family adhesin SdrC [Chloroflexota bacterium]
MQKLKPLIGILTALALLITACSGRGTAPPPATVDPSAAPDIGGTWNGQFLDLAGGIQRIATLTLERGEGEAITGAIAFNTLDAAMPEFYAISGTYDGTTLRVSSSQEHFFWGAFSGDTWNGYAAWGCYDCPDSAWAQFTLQRGIHVIPVESGGGTTAILPGDPVTMDSWAYDAFADPTLPYVTYGDNYQRNLYERPFDIQMRYRPDTDIDWAFLSYGADWIYISIMLRGDDPATQGKNSDYAVEFDLNLDGRGDTLVQVFPPFTTFWTNTNAIVYQDANGDVGGPNPLLSDAPIKNDGYENVPYSMGSGADPNGAWARLAPQDNAFIQVAFRPSYINNASSFLWGVWADSSQRNPLLFDYNDAFTRIDAGSPLQGDPNYPLNALYLLDNTCRVAYGFTPTGKEPGICTPEDDSMISQQGGSQASNPTPPSGIVVLAQPTGTPASGIVVLAQPTGTPASGGDYDPTMAPPPANGTVSGQVWQDTNGDGVRQADEPGWSSEAVVLRTDGYGGTCNVTVATTLPNKSGHYQFTDVWPTPYCVVFLTSQPTGACSTSQNVTVPAGGTATADFCVHASPPPPSITDTPAAAGTGAISGFVYWDMNSDGVQDAGEAGESSQPVGLYREDCNTALFVTYPDSNGAYSFSGLELGTYCVIYYPPSGYSLGSPGGIVDSVGVNDVMPSRVDFRILPPG